MSDAALISPIQWYRRADVRAAMRALNLNESQLFANARAEADGLAVWCRWIPGVLEAIGGDQIPRGTGNLRVDDPAAAIAANFQPTE